MRAKLFLSTGIAGLLATVAQAQDASAPAAAPAPATAAAQDAGDIIVTANKRASNLQQVPIAVTAVSESRLSSINLSNLSNISAVSPSIVFIPAPNPNAVQFVVRGIGTFAFSDTLEQSVGVAIDGVPLGRIAGAAVDAVDIQRVEVLRGPQGTVFGKSATAGLISIVTNKAQLNDTSFSGRGYYGQHKEWRIQGTANVPLVDDKIALRLSAWSFNHDGYIIAPHQTSDGNVGDMHNKGVRLRGAFQLSPDWRVDIGAEYADNGNDGTIQTIRSYYANDFLAVPGGVSVAARNNLEGIIAGPKNIALGSDAPLGGYVRPQFYTLESTWNIGDHTLTSLTGYRKILSKQIGEFDYANSLPGSYTTYQRYQSNIRQLTSELRLANGSQHPLQYTLGLFYYDLDIPNSTIEQSYLNNPSIPAAFNYAQGRRLVSTMNTKNYAAFLDASYRLGKLKFIGGARVSQENSRGTLVRGLPLDGHPLEAPLATYVPSQTRNGYQPLNLRSTTKYTDFSWRGGLQYEFDRDVMVYATASRAYKGPGFNFSNDLTQAIFDVNQSRVKPEIAHSYEAGIRSQWFDRTVTLNLSAYYSMFDNFQITAALPSATGGLSYTIINANQLRSKGVELEFGWRPRGPLQGLSFDGNVSYTDAYYQDFTNAPCYVGQVAVTSPTTQPGVCAPTAVGSASTLQSVNGLAAVGAPKWQLNLFAGYERPVSSRVVGFIQGHYFEQTSNQQGVGNNPATLVPGYHTVDLNFGIRAADNKWKFSVVGKNIFDRFFISRLITNTPLMQAIPYEAFSAWGASFGVRF